MIFLNPIILIPLLLCWGSFLNVVAYRLIHDGSIFFGRSQCIHCHHQLAWYHLIPVLSYIFLQKKCAFCKKTISWLYPFIELFTALCLYLMFTNVPAQFWFGYFIFFSALMVTIRTDLETFMISRFATLFLLPIAFILSYLEYIPLNLEQVLLGCITGYFFLLAISSLYYWLTGRVGMGQGDIELLSLIGAFCGIEGWWITIVIASSLGSLSGIIFLFCSGKKTTKIQIPFGPFLAFGAMSYVLWQTPLKSLLLAL